jgi:hypothetical protein
MRITNIAIKQGLKELEKMTDPYEKALKTCELAGLVAFYGHTKNNSFESMKNAEKMALDTIDTLIKRHKL